MLTAEVAAILLGGMALTYGTRLSFLVLPRPDRLPPLFRRGLRLVAPAVLAAILAQQVVGADAPAGLLSPRPIALLLAAAIGWRSRNTWLTIAGGMTALWLLQAALPA